MGAGRRDVLNLGCLVWNVPSIAPRLGSVTSRRDADVALEDPREVALVGESGLLRDRGDARVAAGELRCRPRQPNAPAVLADRGPVARAKFAREMCRMDADRVASSVSPM